MAFDADKVDPRYADLFYHGRPGPEGKPEGLTDEQWDAQRDLLRSHGDYPFDTET